MKFFELVDWLVEYIFRKLDQMGESDLDGRELLKLAIELAKIAEILDRYGEREAAQRLVQIVLELMGAAGAFDDEAEESNETEEDTQSDSREANGVGESQVDDESDAAD